MIFHRSFLQNLLNKHSVGLILLVLPLLSIAQATKKRDNRKINITLLQINDVYEISPLDSGRSGGLARVATIRKQLQKQNPNTYTLLAGDFISPSAIGTLRYDDKNRISGRQMVSVLNATGVDLVTFGNHEFDNSVEDLQRCIDSSKFQWLSANVKPLYASGHFIKDFRGKREPIPEVYIKKFTDADGTTVSVGFIGLTLETKAGEKYVFYEDYIKRAGKAIDSLKKKKCNIIIALTHLSQSQDSTLAQHYPQLSMIIGGHEHVAWDSTVNGVLIVKADANVKTVYKHFLTHDKYRGVTFIRSELQKITDSIPDDPETKRIVDRWNSKASELVEKQVKSPPCTIVAQLHQTFDGTEASVRTKPTLLTMAIGKAMLKAIPDSLGRAHFALYNSGSVRIDDSLKGAVKIYDLFRVLPFNGNLRVDTLTGSVILRLLDTSVNNPKDGCFLQTDGSIQYDDIAKRWTLAGKPINPADTFYVAISDYLADGLQQKMEFMGTENKRKGKVITDLMTALINYFKTEYPARESGNGKDIIPCY
jgi:2',3'-cyclic-nucleotide 2'-phosphodiesterase (5'-nucleotidase family)